MKFQKISLEKIYFIEKFNEKYGKNIEYADNDSMDILMNYDWPGNIK